jgi:hypothetical protein
MATNPPMVGGFSSARPARRRRMVMSLAGLDKSGKTHQGLSAPGPSAYVNHDTGLEGVIEKFTKDGKTVYSKDYRVVIPPEAAGDVVRVAGIANDVWGGLKSDLRAAWKSTVIRTAIVDTESETWQLVRLARFGKLTQVMPHHYGPVNAEYTNFWNEVYDTDKNLILLGRLKEEYENTIVNGKEIGKKTGRLERVGYKDIPYLVQINAIARFNPANPPGDRFSIEIVNCRQNSEVAGMVLPEALCSFQTLAMTVFPDSNPSDWE